MKRQLKRQHIIHNLAKNRWNKFQLKNIDRLKLNDEEIIEFRDYIATHPHIGRRDAASRNPLNSGSLLLICRCSAQRLQSSTGACRNPG